MTLVDELREFAMKYWMDVTSKEHASWGASGGYCQLCHGKVRPLCRMSQGDWIIYCSPQQVFGEKEPCQQLTTICT